MIEFLSANMGTIFIIFILAAVVGMILLKLKKDKGSGRSSCGCGCGCCPNASLCRSGSISEKKSYRNGKNKQ